MGNLQPILGGVQSTELLGGTQGTAFRFQFLALAQFLNHAIQTTPSALIIPETDGTDLGPYLPVWNMTTVTMLAPNADNYYRSVTTNPPYATGAEAVWSHLGVPHPATPATVTANAQCNFVQKHMGIIPMRTTPGVVGGEVDVVTDWTGFIPLQQNKLGKVKYKLHMLATLPTDSVNMEVMSY